MNFCKTFTVIIKHFSIKVQITEGGRERGRHLSHLLIRDAVSTSLRRIIIVNCPGRIEMDIMEDNEVGSDGSDHQAGILFISFC